jgi:rhodanese-related sulfurtransferase
MKKIALLVITLVAVLGLSACAKGYTNISNEELQEMLDSDDDIQFIDVRTSTEFYDERIPGFRNIDYYLLEEDYSLIDHLDPSKPTVIMCNSGNRSVDASKIFVDQGFTEVYNLTDGIQGWNGETE